MGRPAQRFHGHVARVAGAQFYTKKGVPVFQTQLMGRWGSMAILRYIQDAPLEVLPESIQEALSGPSLGSVVQEMATGDDQTELVRRIEEKLETQSVQIAACIHEIQALADRFKKNDSKAVHHVQNKATGVVHRICFGGQLSIPELWTTACGWNFGTSDRRRIDMEAALNLKHCKKCWRLSAGRAEPLHGEAHVSDSSESDGE